MNPRASESRPGTSPRRWQAEETPPLHILIVEDNPTDVLLLREMFSAERPDSFQLSHLSTLGEALNYLAECSPDIVILDLGLPDGDGVDNVRRVRRAAPHIPVVVLTGRDDDESVAQAMREGAQDYLVKGQIGNRALPHALRHAIERFSLHAEAALTNFELERRVREKDTLLSEIHHRVKNNLQVISSLLGLESNRISDTRVIGMLQTVQDRIRSMAFIHQTLYRAKDFTDVDFKAFLQSFVPTLVQSYSIYPDRISVVFEVADVKLPINAAIPCGLIVNELVSNALKHGFPMGRSGTIRISFMRDGARQAVLSVSDDGVGIPEDFDPQHLKSLGIQLVYLLAGQLGGEARLERSGSTRFVVRFHLDFPEPKAN